MATPTRWRLTDEERAQTARAGSRPAGAGRPPVAHQQRLAALGARAIPERARALLPDYLEVLSVGASQRRRLRAVDMSSRAGSISHK